MAIPFTNAAAAYANTAAQGLKPGLGASTAGGPSFGEMLKTAAEDAIGTLHAGEQKSIEGVAGKADLTDVVTAISNAEVTLQAVTTIRDKVIGAYQEMLRMPM